MQQDNRLKSMETMLLQLVEAKDATNSDIASTSTQMADLEKTMSQLEISRESVRRDLALVRSLSFKARTIRHDAIPVAHQETFQWVFSAKGHEDRTADSNKPQVGDLAHWLKARDGTFWVSGKPGSGKSTFMKLIEGHPQTKKALAQWAHPHPVFIASHYFWSPGTDMQKSQQGLLQSLLYDVFSHCPELGQVACPTRWAASKSDAQGPWTLSELLATLKTISTQTRVKCKFCFFIDGLDEFKGDHIDFCDDLMAMMDSPNIKFCVSSRPWNVFEDAFGEDSTRKLYIHELTKSDIAKYTKDRLHQHRRWRLLASRTPRAEGLVNTITEKSQGVFLWVFIVTKILRESLTNDDSFSDLQKRVETFPVDLEPFFKQILESVPTFYKEKMVKTLQIALAAKEPLHAVIYSFNDEADDGFNQGLDTLNPEYDPEVVRARQEQVARRLNGRCRCLLEMNFLGQIDFLHRTVADFLRTSDMSNYLSERTPHGFCPNLAIFRAHTAWLKSTGVVDGEFSLRSLTPSGTSELVINVCKALAYVARAETEAIADLASIDFEVDDMEHTVVSLTSSVSSSAREVGFTDEDMVLQTSFPEMVLGVPLLGYLSRRMGRDRTFLSAMKQPAIMAVLYKSQPKVGEWPTQVVEKLECLFRNGCSPGELTRKPVAMDSDSLEFDLFSNRMMTVWEWFVSRAFILNDDSPLGVSPGHWLVATLRKGLFQLFLQNGADPNVLWRPEEGSKRPAVQGLLGLAFSLPADAIVESACLRVIDSFIQYGARIGIYDNTWKNPLSQTLSGVGGSGSEHEPDGPHRNFLDKLEMSFKESRTKEPERLPFRLEVMHKAALLAGGGTERLRATISECSKTVHRASTAHPISVPVKRPLETGGPQDRAEKIPKLR
jgi:hypothetical protein